MVIAPDRRTKGGDTVDGITIGKPTPPNLYMGEAEGAYTYRCGVCGAFLMSGLKGSRLEAWADDIRDYKCYCEHCGTRIDWKGAEEP